MKVYLLTPVAFLSALRGAGVPAAVPQMWSGRYTRKVVVRARHNRVPPNPRPLPPRDHQHHNFLLAPQHNSTIMTTQARPVPRIGHTQGPTLCTYTPDGSKLVTVGQNEVVRVYHTRKNEEPKNIDDQMGQKLGVTAAVGSLHIHLLKMLMSSVE